MTAPAYRIGQAADLLGVSADTMRRWADAGRVKTTRTAGGQRLVDGVDLARLAVEVAEGAAEAEPRAQSTRNRFPGIVTKVERDKVSARVEMQAGPHRIVSLMTTEAADELALAPGMLAVAAVKATTVVVERHDLD
jgi:molybdopterin-binding protein